MKIDKTFKWVVIIAIIVLVVICCCQFYFYTLVFLRDGWHNTANYLAFFNLIVDVVVGALTIFGLSWAAKEFQASQAKSDLDLVFSETDGPHELTISLPKLKGYDTHWVNIGLTNTGNKVERWYIAHFEVPSVFLITDTSYFNILQIISGTYPDNWKISKNGDIWRYTFVSNGANAVYPSYDTLLCQFGFKFMPGYTYQPRYDIPYVITTEDKQKKGFLILNVKQDSNVK